MNGKCIPHMNFLVEAMEHYRHAREKHPYFADSLGEPSDYYSKVRLNHWRTVISMEKQIGHVRALTLLQCEIAEIMDAKSRNETAHAIEECYDAMAVLMRMIDVLEGRQKLGKPVAIGEYQAQEWGLEKPVYDGTNGKDDGKNGNDK